MPDKISFPVSKSRSPSASLVPRLRGKISFSNSQLYANKAGEVSFPVSERKLTFQVPNQRQIRPQPRENKAPGIQNGGLVQLYAGALQTYAGPVQFFFGPAQLYAGPLQTYAGPV